MNKTAIKNFAKWARTKLINEIIYKAKMIGITENGVSKPLSVSTDNIQFFDIGTGQQNKISNEQIKQRESLVSKLREKENTSDYKTAFESIIEEIAYTWFNRLIAIRFMEINEYLPSKIRVLSSEMKGKSEPDIVTKPFDTDIEFTEYEKEKIIHLKDQNELDELFRMLFIKQCNKLNEILPELFEKTSDYTELLLTISFTDSDGIVSHLVNDIEEEDFTEAVEIIGWLYQYYNTEPKDDVFALLKKNIKITKERIPAATQLFTPDWIVRYMVENSLGKLWIEGHPNENLKSEWKYYLEEAEQEESVNLKLQAIRQDYKDMAPEDIKLVDICMGSGHILVYAFDVLMQIYESQGYTQRDAASAIIENNIYGLDIDDRAYQLAYFAIMMKARKYDRRFLTRDIMPKLYSIKESNNINVTIPLSKDAKETLEYLFKTFEDAKEYGSILDVEKREYDKLLSELETFEKSYEITIENRMIKSKLPLIKNLVYQAKVMSEKYDVVITNPPYMGGSGMNTKLSSYVKKNYPDSKSDLFAVFIEKCAKITKNNRYQAMITQHAFMFLSSYEKLRSKLLLNDFVNMAHLGARAFEEIGGEVVQTTAFVIRKSNLKNYKATFARLVDYNSQQEKEKAFLEKNNLHTSQKENFSKIPGSPIAYWVSENFIKTFEEGVLLKDYGKASEGIKTGNNDYFLRLWFEVCQEKFSFGINSTSKKWFPHHKGGEYRKWYGNLEFVVNWENDGYEIKNSSNSGLQGKDMYFKDVICWSKITSKGTTLRYIHCNCLFDSGSPAFKCTENLYYVLGFINTVGTYMLQIINPTLNCQVGDIKSLPLIIEPQLKGDINELVKQSIDISKIDWDIFETSWDFKGHPLINFGVSVGSGLGDLEDKEPIAQSEIGLEKTDTSFKIYEKNSPKNYTIHSSFKMWKENCENRFLNLKSNEEKLNRIFIDIYGLEDELTPDVSDKDITVYRVFDTKDDVPESMKGSKYILTKQDVIKSFVSYAVGCMFGRYSLDVDGLAFAGGEWDNSKYSTFIPDEDNCIPITDEEYFSDDIVGRFVEFVKCVYGTDTLEENLDFIADALVVKGDSSRDIIRNYFIKDFYKDHVKTYQKRPIYWLYESGKQNGFKALVYMHRYTVDTTGIVRVDYLHKMQKIYMSEIERMTDMEENSKNSREVVEAKKRKEKLVKQLKETKEYDEKIAHIALSRIGIDLDDGVKVNYEKIQIGQDGKKLEILGKI